MELAFWKETEPVQDPLQSLHPTAQGAHASVPPPQCDPAGLAGTPGPSPCGRGHLLEVLVTTMALPPGLTWDVHLPVTRRALSP